MLVKDIELVRAILDLIDNSIDGARRLHGKKDRYDDLFIRIEATADHFRIVDNCGGMSVDVARHYAFRFGRPADMPKTSRSVGQFGVGMKRALFKLGTAFRIDSTTQSSSFVIEVNVDKWKLTDQWVFGFKTLKENVSDIDPEKIGTAVRVAPLHESVREEFRLENFLAGLKTDLEAAHQESMERGIAISLNKIPLQLRPAELLASEDIQPAYEELKFEKFDVIVKLYAGVAKSDPAVAGWYIYCNGRMVLEADQTIVTGWGEGQGKTIPKYHNQFSRFRGYAFFDSDDAAALPWNTTKSGVDGDAPLYKSVRQKMLSLMRPVIDFLNKLDAEKEQASSDKPLNEIVKDAKAQRLTGFNFSTFKVSARSKTQRAAPPEQKIIYMRPSEKIKKVKAALQVSSLRDVGERTFDYFYREECED